MTIKTVDINTYEDLVEYAEANAGVDRLYLQNSHFIKLSTGMSLDLYAKVVRQDEHGRIFISVGRMEVRPK